jgi:hypothetical protein
VERNRAAVLDEPAALRRADAEVDGAHRRGVDRDGARQVAGLEHVLGLAAGDGRVHEGGAEVHRAPHRPDLLGRGPLR